MYYKPIIRQANEYEFRQNHENIVNPIREINLCCIIFIKIFFFKKANRSLYSVISACSVSTTFKNIWLL